MTDRYNHLVKRELDSYKDVRPELAIPRIFTYWASQYLAPRMRAIMGTHSPEEFFAIHLGERLRRPNLPKAILSLGCGDCVSEIEVCRFLVKMGLSGFRFDCLDLSPHVLERAKQAVVAAGFEQFFELRAVDANAWKPAEGAYAGIMANHSLHHFVELEHIFASVRHGLCDEGVFVNSDMIGRNGHMRWPEAEKMVDMIWRFIPEHYKYNHLLKRDEKEFVNWDCADGSFEGVRAQDILPLLTKNFHFEKFIAFGNLPDVFVDRTFGPNLSIDEPKDVAFIDFLEELNTTLVNAGQIKPTQMFAVMGKHANVETVCDRGWTPQYCLRQPEPEPAATAEA